jgi:hypothetical protein
MNYGMIVKGAGAVGMNHAKPMLFTKLLNYFFTCAKLAGMTNRTFRNLIWPCFVSNIRFQTEQFSGTSFFVSSFLTHLVLFLQLSFSCIYHLLFMVPSKMMD